jgi:hypothetical protein
VLRVDRRRKSLIPLDIRNPQVPKVLVPCQVAMTLLFFIRYFPVRELVSFLRIPERGSGRARGWGTKKQIFGHEKEYELCKAMRP